jgi:hypothetical protein
MSIHPFGPDELDRQDASLDAVADRLERYASDHRVDAPAGLAASIRAAIDEAPDPAVGWWSRLLAGPAAWGAPARMAATAGVFVLVVAGALAAGQFAQWARSGGGSGSSPSVPAVVSPSPSTSPTPTESPTPSPSPSPSPSDTPTPTRTPNATPSDDDDDDDEVGTPEPSESDNSGPGGGDDDDDSSGPGSGDDSGGSGSGGSGSGSDD